jgi:hypothetical protein
MYFHVVVVVDCPVEISVAPTWYKPYGDFPVLMMVEYLRWPIVPSLRHKRALE